MVAPGGCVVAPGGRVVARGGGHVWLLWGSMHCCSGEGMCGCSWEDVHGCSGGHAWLLWGACMVARGGAWLLWGGVRGCSRGGMCGIRREMEIRSMSGRYASYWNAFLF